MNTIFKVYKYSFFSLFLSLLFLASCKKEDDLGNAPRVFRPLISCTIGSTSPYITADWTNLTATSYTLELSTDTFKTVLQSVEVDTCQYKFENLTWDVSYQLRVKRHTADLESDYFTLVGVNLTFPTFLQAFTADNITDVGIRTRWSQNDSAYTSIKVFNATDNSVVKDVAVSATDLTNKYSDIYGLSPSTKYKVVAYKNGRYQGYKNVTTVASQVYAKSIDLRSIDDATAATMITTDYLASLESGTVLILKRGLSYTIGTVNFSKSVMFTTGLGFGNNLALLDLNNGNFDVTASSVIDSLKFKNVNLIGLANGYGNKYVLNVSTACSVSRFIIDGCSVGGLRGVVRVKTTGGAIDSMVINNSVIDSIGGYGIAIVDASGAYIRNIKVANSTISDAQVLFKNQKSTNGTESIYINNCTFCYAPYGGPAYCIFDYKGQTITRGITILNSLWGPGKTNSSSTLTDKTAFNGYLGNNISIVAQNNFKTSDLVFNSNDIAFDAFSGNAAALFVDPGNDNFTIKATTFSGKSTTGDPRWRP